MIRRRYDLCSCYLGDISYWSKGYEVFDIVLIRQNLLINLLGTFPEVRIHLQQLQDYLLQERRVNLLRVQLQDERLKLAGVECAVLEVVQL